MDIVIDEIAADTFRLSRYSPQTGFVFNQFVIRDDEPLLYHTGFQKSFPDTWQAVATLFDPTRLRWIGFSHFEPDESGALNSWLAAAPEASVIASPLSAGVILDDYAIRPPRILNDGERLTTGRHRFEWLATPHLPHGWDASLLFDETTRTLFCSDLFLQSGHGPALVETDIVEPARQMIISSLGGPFAHSIPWTNRTETMFKRLTALQPNMLALMHGPAFQGDGAKALTDLAGALARMSNGASG